MDLLITPFRPFFMMCVAATLLPMTATGCVKGDVDVCADDPTTPGCSDAGDAGDSSTDSTMGDAGDAGDTAVDAGRCAEVCMGPTPLCNETTGMCVACLADSDCTDLAAPQCDETGGTCGACDSGAA